MISCDVGRCSECGDIATVLHEDSEGYVTPLCETCLNEIKLKQKSKCTCLLDEAKHCCPLFIDGRCDG